MHWGGGTPTFLSHGEMQRLIEATARHFRLRDDDTGEYALEIDPRERANLFDSHPGRAARLVYELRQLIDIPSQGSAVLGLVEPDADTLEQLRALGYLR